MIRKPLLITLTLAALLVALPLSAPAAAETAPSPDYAHYGTIRLEGTLDINANPVADYPLELAAGDPITAILDCAPKPGTLDPYLLVYGPDGTLLTPIALFTEPLYDDGIADGQCGGGYSGGTYSFFAPIDGQYVFRVTSYDYLNQYADLGTGSGGYILELFGEFTGIPGCDDFITEGDTVGAVLLADTIAYWAPGEITAPRVTLNGGDSVRVRGVNDDGTYYQIVYACELLWVPAGTLGPNFDAVWQGTPLPGTVLKDK
ncbi:MAG: hypothetical protein GYB65_15745 [Chloroflexi bacterium]|nr:hypothetical protein [Chloroflexota bacterium]